VTVAALALAAAWLLSATALAVNQLALHGAGIGPGPSMGIVSLIVQAAAIALVMRGHDTGRILVLLFFVLATLPLGMAPHLIGGGSLISALYTMMGFALKGVATLLLYTGASRDWFATAARREMRHAPSRRFEEYSFRPAIDGVLSTYVMTLSPRYEEAIRRAARSRDRSSRHGRRLAGRVCAAVLRIVRLVAVRSPALGGALRGDVQAFERDLAAEEAAEWSADREY
jgi:hypothetical protein